MFSLERNRSILTEAMVETHEYDDTAVAHVFVRRSLRYLQQPQGNDTSSTINRLSLAAIILVPLLLFIILFMCAILYCYYIPHVQYKDQKQQYRFKNDSNTATLDHHSDGGNGSDSTEADDSLNNETNTPVIQSIEIDTEEIDDIEANYRANTMASTTVVVAPPQRISSQSSLHETEHPRMTILHRRPSYSQTLEETLLQYGGETSTINIFDRSKTNPSDRKNPGEDDNNTNNDDDDNQTTTTNGPICIDDGTSYDGNDSSDGDDDDDECGGGRIDKIRTDAHSPIDQILIFSDVENSSDDDNDEHDEEASLSQRSYNSDPYRRFYQSSGGGSATIDHHRLAATTGTTTSLLALLNFDSDTKHVPNHSANNIFKSSSNQDTKLSSARDDRPNDDDDDDNVDTCQPGSSKMKRPSMRRSCSVSSTSSSLYDDIEEQAWIEFQQQSFDNGDTQTFLYQAPSPISSLTTSPSKNQLLLLLPPPAVHHMEDDDDDDYYSKRMENVRSLDGKQSSNHSSNNNSSTLTVQYDDLQRQRQLWDRIQHLPLSLASSSSSSSLASRKLSQPASSAASSHIARQKVEL